MRVVYDTNVIIRYRVDMTELPRAVKLSAVVVQEMTAGAREAAFVEAWRALLLDFQKENRLLTPDAEDWWFAGKVLNSLFRLPSRRGQPSIGSDEQRRLIRDTLIARTAKREGVTVITEDVEDFAKIQRFCAVKIIHPKDYF
jgi:predicted nucleic acid-binding protein